MRASYTMAASEETAAVARLQRLHGGNGYLNAYPIERFLRDAKMNQIGEGTSEVHKNLIGRYVMKTAAAMTQHPCLDFEPDLFGAQ